MVTQDNKLHRLLIADSLNKSLEDDKFSNFFFRIANERSFHKSSVGRVAEGVSRPTCNKGTFNNWWSRYALRNERSGLLDHQGVLLFFNLNMQFLQLLRLNLRWCICHHI